MGTDRRRPALPDGARARGALWAGVSVAKYVRENGVPDISPQRVHEAIDSAGVLGVVVYVAGFALAELLHLPAAGVHNEYSNGGN